MIVIRFIGDLILCGFEYGCSSDADTCELKFAWIFLRFCRIGVDLVRIIIWLLRLDVRAICLDLDRT